jgi:hypothetical protein
MSRERTNTIPPDYGKFKAIDSDVNYDKNIGISKSTANLKKESLRFSWSGYKRAFKVNNDRRNSSSFLDSESNESGENSVQEIINFNNNYVNYVYIILCLNHFMFKGIEMLSMKYKSSLRRQEIQSSQENNDKNSNQWSDSAVNDYSISDHITAEGLGIESQTYNHSQVITVSKVVLFFQYYKEVLNN